MASKLIWHGDEILAKVSRVVPRTIDETTQDAADEAKSSHWWGRRRGVLESEIINDPARRTGRMRWTGKFGSTRTRGFYGLILEYRNPFLRPAADATFRRLAVRIKRAFQ